MIYFDASVRFTCPGFLTDITVVMETSGIALVDETGHSTFAATHPSMYQHLHPDIPTIQKSMQLGGGLYGILNTPTMLEKVMNPLVNCSLNKDCISPTGANLGCSFKKGPLKDKTYANCHRFDQSALNILLTKLFKDNITAYKANATCALVNRSVTHMYKIQLCK